MGLRARLVKDACVVVHVWLSVCLPAGFTGQVGTKCAGCGCGCSPHAMRQQASHMAYMCETRNSPMTSESNDSHSIVESCMSVTASVVASPCLCSQDGHSSSRQQPQEWRWQLSATAATLLTRHNSSTSNKHRGRAPGAAPQTATKAAQVPCSRLITTHLMAAETYSLTLTATATP